MLTMFNNLLESCFRVCNVSSLLKVYSFSSLRESLSHDQKFDFDSVFEWFIFLMMPDCGDVVPNTEGFHSFAEKTTLQNAFFIGLQFLIYLKYCRSTRALRSFVYLLKYRGLSNTGVHFLHELGLCSGITALKSHQRWVQHEFGS